VVQGQDAQRTMRVCKVVTNVRVMATRISTLKSEA
jgi:hypothetical protein